MQSTSELKACVERFSQALDDIRRSATEQEVAATKPLDTEKHALQTKITTNRVRLNLLRELMHTWQQEQEAAS
ncbi:hypothetical protein ColTof4_13581 [Colletotrichum tofieldiae]|nr:hypothetical protein ColTof3_14530 [Colletotrichum tofieldiae]GKT81158.1 hypothetical protein ColTof4_13581 [Colletotrichum tofieldiae]GKT97330.1 hypothetical protein Ct61P_15180 [Colletotrichum tofieldiae]